MKKILFSALVLCATAASAQIKTNAGTFTKPTTGDIIMEINFYPDVTGSGGGIFSLPTIMSTDDGSLLGIKARKFKSDKKAYRALANLSVKNSGEEGADTDFSLGLGLGIENHMKGAERLSTYWGYEGKLGFVSETGVSKFGVAANLLAGFDYYIMPSIYLGAEVTYGIGIVSTTPEGGDATTSFAIAPGVSPSFRLGWRF